MAVRARGWFLVLGLIVMLFAGAVELSSENVTLTTYYPAPSGVYTQMTTTMNTFLSRNGGGLAVGTAVAPTGSTKMVVMGGNVGIGMTPVNTLDVAGNIGATGSVKVGYAPSCTAAKEGTLRWNSGNLQGCKAGAWTTIGGSVQPPVIMRLYIPGFPMWVQVSANGGYVPPGSPRLTSCTAYTHGVYVSAPMVNGGTYCTFYYTVPVGAGASDIVVTAVQNGVYYSW